MKNLKFNTNFSLWGIDIYIHSDSQELFELAVDYFHGADLGSENSSGKRIDFYLCKKKTLISNRWDLDHWKKKIYRLDSLSMDVRTRLDYERNIIRGYLSSGSRFPREEIEELLIFRPLSLLLAKFGFFVMHAGCVAKNGKGILITSPYGRGKTITTLKLVQQGYKFLGDEFVLLKQENGRVKALAFPQRIGLKKNLISQFDELKFLKNRKDSPHRKKRFWIDEAYPKVVVKACYPELVLFPDFQNNGRLDLSKICKKESLSNILKDQDSFSFKKMLTYQDITRRYFQTLSNLVEQAKIYRLTYSNKKLDGLDERLKAINNKV